MIMVLKGWWWWWWWLNPWNNNHNHKKKQSVQDYNQQKGAKVVRVKENMYNMIIIMVKQFTDCCDGQIIGMII